MVGNLVLNGGAGDDTILINGSSAQGVIAVNAGDGDDQVTLTGVTGLSDLSLSLGEGFNRLSVSNTGVVKEASISGQVHIELNSDTFARNLNIAVGDGGIGIGIYSTTILNDLSLVSGAGQDNVQLGTVSAKIISVDLGGGDDIFDASAITTDHFFAELGAGNDSLAILNSTLNDYGLLDGGPGANVMSYDNTTHAKTTSVNF
jgi:hypothetical protein